VNHVTKRKRRPIDLKGLKVEPALDPLRNFGPVPQTVFFNRIGPLADMMSKACTLAARGHGFTVLGAQGGATL
jgi:hypothetical protein